MVLFSKESFAAAVRGLIGIQRVGRIAEIVFDYSYFQQQHVLDCTSSGSNYSTYLIDVGAKCLFSTRIGRKIETWRGLHLIRNLHGQNNN